jgi:signal transduction histidine kinase
MKKRRGIKAGFQEQTQRFSLVVLLAIVCFIVLLSAVLLAIGLVFLLIRLNVFEGVPEEIRMSNIVLILILTSAVMGWALVLLLGKFPLKPINLLVDGLNSLAAGNFKTRISYKKNLLKNFQTFREIEATFNKLAKELESTEMLRSDFINNFSHEFKTPIVSIAGFAKLLKKGNLSEEQKAQYLEAIEEESMRLAYMATNILNMTKVENQEILSDITEFNLSEQVRFAVLLLEDKWVKKNVEFQLDFDEYTIEANEELLKQVWINLMDNAIKFSPRGAEVSLDIHEVGSSYHVSVSNRGQDIPKDKQKKLFNKFYQADESHAQEGNGIGLAIVKKIVDLHDGKVSFQSENGLTVFTVELPKKQWF